MSQNRKKIKAWKYKNKIIGALQLSLIHKPAISVSQILHFFFKQIYQKKKSENNHKKLENKKDFLGFSNLFKNFYCLFLCMKRLDLITIWV